MNKISGKVIVKESGVGIPDLLIVIYDLDPECNLDEILSSKKALSGTEFWNQFKGDRIGSVLTSNLGMFELSYEDTEFQVQDVEKRPDLVLLVMAPEEPRSINQRISTPPQNLMLYCSNIPRSNAGRSESYLIRLMTDQLDKLKIPYPKDVQRSLLDKDSLLLEFDRYHELSNAVREKLSEHLSQRFAKSNEDVEKVKEAFANFNPSSVPAEVREDPTYLKPGQDLLENQKAVIEHDLKKLNELKIRRPLRLRLSEEQLADLGLKVDDNGKVSGTVDFQKILTHIEKTMQGASLYRARSPFEARQKRKEASRIIDEITSSNEGPI